MIELINLSKRYGKKEAVSNINLKVEKGEILGFLGPNGAGKSTTMNMICGYISASEGKVLIDGTDILEDPIGAKKKIGYLPEMPPLYVNMTVDEYLDFAYDLKKIKGNKKDELLRVKELVKITSVSHRLIKNLSKGYRQRVGLAQALLGMPSLLILDEPTVGLDPKQIMEIRSLISDLKKDHTVILSSHILSEISAVCDRVVIIKDGKIVAEDTPENLSQKMTGAKRFLVRAKGDETVIFNALSQILDSASFSKVKSYDDNSTEYEINAKEDIRASISTVLFQNDCPVISMTEDTLSLEDIFLKVTGKDMKNNEGNL